MERGREEIDARGNLEMILEEAVSLLRRHLEGRFPKVCVNCGRRFDSLHEYVQGTIPRGSPRSFDADLQDWETRSPIGSLAYADCPCGNTLALGTEGMALADRLALLAWLREQSERRAVPPTVVLEELRAAVRSTVTG